MEPFPICRVLNSNVFPCLDCLVVKTKNPPDNKAITGDCTESMNPWTSQRHEYKTERNRVGWNFDSTQFLQRCCYTAK